MRAELISIGTELAAGITVDTNAAWLAGRLAEVGIPAVRHVTVADDRAEVAAELRRAAGGAELVVVTGGLGPTEDDLTRPALADALGVGLRTSSTALEQVRAYFLRAGRKWHESNARQAEFPEGTTPIENRWGTAPGIRAVVGASIVYCLPGVPREMAEMFAAAVLPEIERRVVGGGDGGGHGLGSGGVILTRTLRCFGAGESNIGEQIADLMQPGRAVSVGTTAQEGMIGVRFTARAASRAEADALIEADMNEARRRLGVLVFGADDQTLESVVGALLVDRGLTLSTAESCTGGLLAKRLTDVPGSSAFFVRGAVTYSNASKTEVLGVDAGLIEEHGAVSAEVAEAMAVGCREQAGTDFALSTTGIAGPSGGSAEKPVGLVYIALADSAGCRVRRFTFGEYLPRPSIRDRACSTALNLLRTRLRD
ncbi:MAG TPA: competence/damage-inducible protein A [Phycisphaerae bacterium]|nr:competence/damage-inducible protein A [Phycisphaerae bacterium]